MLQCLLLFAILLQLLLRTAALGLKIIECLLQLLLLPVAEGNQLFIALLLRLQCSIALFELLQPRLLLALPRTPGAQLPLLRQLPAAKVQFLSCRRQLLLMAGQLRLGPLQLGLELVELPLLVPQLSLQGGFVLTDAIDLPGWLSWTRAPAMKSISPAGGRCPGRDS